MRQNRFITGVLGLAVVIALIVGINLLRGSARQSSGALTPTPTSTNSIPESTLTSTPEPIFALAKTDVYLRNQTKTAIAAQAIENEVTASPTATSTGAVSTQTSTATVQAVSTQPPALTNTPAPSSTGAPTRTSTSAPLPTNTLIATATKTVTPTPVLGSLSGRITFLGAPATADLVLSLEDSSANEVGRVNLAGDGSYTFAHVPPSSQGYRVVFAQAWNEQYGSEQVLSWALIGPIPLSGAENLRLPDFDISTLGFSQSNPTGDTTFYTYAITPETPILFTWAGYPGATSYWVDLAQGDEQVRVWQSSTTAMTAAAFDGTLADSTHIPPGEYWWAVGAQGSVGGYPLTIYGYLWRFVVNP